MYRDQYEPIGVLEIGSSEPRCATQERRARRARSNVWRYPSATSLPLAFSDALRSARLVPVALMADAIKTARVATTSFSIRPAARRITDRGRACAGRATLRRTLGSSTSRSAGGRRRRVGRHSTPRAACRSIQSRRAAVASPRWIGTMSAKIDREAPPRRGEGTRSIRRTGSAPAGRRGIRFKPGQSGNPKGAKGSRRQL